MEMEDSMSQVALPLYEDEFDALRDAVRALGGNKTVGHALRPDLGPLRAGDWLKDCLNPERRERLSLTQTMRIMRMAHDVGYHGPAQYLAAEMGYQAVPIEPRDEAAELQRASIAAVAHLQRIVTRLEQLQGGNGPMAAAVTRLRVGG